VIIRPVDEVVSGDSEDDEAWQDVTLQPRRMPSTTCCRR
jgi:hypothetical protein